MENNSLRHKVYVMAIIATYIFLDSLFSLIIGYPISLEIGLFRIGILVILDMIPNKYYLKFYSKFILMENSFFNFLNKIKTKEDCEA